MPGVDYAFKRAGTIALLDKIEAMVIATPGLTRIAMAERLALESSTVGVYLAELNRRNKIFMLRGHGNVVTWWPGVNPAPAKKRPPPAAKERRQQHQTVVTSWAPNQVRDPFALSADFFRRTP